MKKIIILSDVHLEFGTKEDKSYTIVKNYIKNVKPDLVVLNGDFLDCSAISSYSKDSPLLTENKRLSDDIKMARKELDYFEKYSKKVIYLAGNHEARLNKLVDKYPVFTDGLLTFPKLLNIDYYVEEEDQPVELIEDLYVMHGHRYGQHLASATVRDYMENVIVGHAHRMQTFGLRTMKRPVVGYSSGCLCGRSPKYLRGKMNTWNNGFVVIDYDNSGFNVNNVLIEDDSFIIDGKRWS